MELDELINVLTSFLIGSGCGGIHTSRGLRDNPSVCHAACEYFLHNFRQVGPVEAIRAVERLNKETLQGLQIAARMEVVNYNRAVRSVQESGHGEGAAEAAALRLIRTHVERPASYSTNIAAAVAAISAAVNAGVTAAAAGTSMIIFIKNEPGMFTAPRGHAICAIWQGGEIFIYDPNIGVVVVDLPATGVWEHALRSIFNWYSEVGLTQFGHMLR